MSKNTDADYISHDPFQGDEADLKCRTVGIRTARKEHSCFSMPGTAAHTIKPGERYRHERARVDNSFWGDYRICLNCLDSWIAEVNGEGEDSAEGGAA